MQKTQAFTLGLLAAIFWGTHSVIVRALTTDMPGLAIAVFRLYIAAAVLYAILKIKKERLRFDLNSPAFWLTTLGATSNYIFFHLGLEHTSASNAMMLENTAPFFVLLFMIVAGEKSSKTEILATFIAILGVYLTVRGDIALGGESLGGDLLELAAGLTWAIFILGSSKALTSKQSSLERLAFLCQVFIASAILLTPALIWTPISAPLITRTDIALLLLLGIFPTAIAYYLWYEAAARVTAVTSALFFTLTIIFTFLNASIFLGEEITLSMALGAVLILVGVLLTRLESRLER